MPFILFFEDQVDHTVARISAAFPNKSDRAVLRQYKKTFDCSVNDSVKYEMIKKATRYFQVALWMKDINSVFIYSNDIFCDSVLRTDKQNAIFQKNIDFTNSALSKICEKGDKKVINTGRAIRSIEHTVYAENQYLWLDIYKVPLHSPSGRICGTLGTGIDLSLIVSAEVKEKYTKTEAIEIPLDVVLTKKKIKEILKKHNGL